MTEQLVEEKATPVQAPFATRKVYFCFFLAFFILFVIVSSLQVSLRMVYSCRAWPAHNHILRRMRRCLPVVVVHHYSSIAGWYAQSWRRHHRIYNALHRLRGRACWNSILSLAWVWASALIIEHWSLLLAIAPRMMLLFILMMISTTHGPELVLTVVCSSRWLSVASARLHL